MGADLYIKKKYDQHQEHPVTIDLDRGYYRESYNASNLLAQFNLSFRQDVYPLLENEELYVDKVNQLLKKLRDHEPIFEKNLYDLLNKKNWVWDYERNYKTGEVKHRPNPKLNHKKRKDYEKSYRQSYAQFKQFLQEAIDLNSSIKCSL